MKRTAITVMTAVVILLFFAFVASAQDNKDVLGDDIFWSFSDNVLTLYGSGKINQCRYSVKNGNIYADVPWNEYSDTISTVVIKDGITSVSGYLFAHMPSLKEVILPQSLISLGTGAFYDCPCLKSITLNDGLNTIGDFCFAKCVALQTLNIPASSEKIGMGFVLCDKNLTGLTVSEDNHCYRLSDNVLFNLYGSEIHTYLHCHGKVYVIPDNVTTLLPYSFSGIELERLYVPDSVNTIDDNAFADSSVDTVYTGFKKENYDRLGTGNVSFSSATRKTKNRFGYCGKTTVWSIENGSLNIFGTGESDAYGAPDGLTNAPWSEYTDEIDSVTVSKSIEALGEYSFYGIGTINSAVIENGLKSIGKHVFSYTGMNKITLPQSVTEVSALSFYHCENLAEINVSSKNNSYKSVDGVLYSADGKTVITYPCAKTGEEYTIKYETEIIGSFAFAFCQLKALYIPLSVKRAENGIIYSSDINKLRFECEKEDFDSIKTGSSNSAVKDAKKEFNCHINTKIIKGKKPTCTQSGLTDGSVCTDCNKTVVKKTKINPTGHTAVTDKAVYATQKANGKTAGSHCKKCGAVIVKQKNVYAVGKVKLSGTSFKYNKKQHKPTVSVYNIKGKKLKNKTDYTVTYSDKNDSKTGKYTVTVKFKGNYSGIKKLSYTVVKKKK